MTTVNNTTTGKTAQTRAEAYKAAFDALRHALATIVQETVPNPANHPYSSDSYLPEHMIEAAKQALCLDAELQTPIPVKVQKTVKTSDPRCEYWTETKTIRGAFVGRDYFDVPIERCSYSNKAEIAVMRAMMKQAAESGEPMCVRDVLVDAGRKLCQPRRGETQYWKAMGFFNLVSDVIISSSKIIRWEEWLDKREQQDIESNLRMDDYCAQRRREIGQKAAATRKARRESRQ